jgi:hypothetical protein
MRFFALILNMTPSNFFHFQFFGLSMFGCFFAAQCPTACRDEEEAVVIGQTLMDRHFLVPLFHSDTFRFSDLFYRFQWDHKELSGQNRSRPRLGSSTAQIASLDAESAAVRPTAADFGQFDPQVLLDLVDRMR